MNRGMELEHLEKAQIGIAKGRERIERQAQLVDRLGRDGHDQSAAMALLDTMRQTLVVMEEHRLLIVKELSG
jgi:hypothetical protein